MKIRRVRAAAGLASATVMVPDRGTRRVPDRLMIAFDDDRTLLVVGPTGLAVSTSEGRRVIPFELLWAMVAGTTTS